jgi:hypothetical protein
MTPVDDSGQASIDLPACRINLERCPKCRGGELKIIAANLERPVIEKILTHLGLDPQPQPKGRARAALHFAAEPRLLSQTHRHRLQRQAAAGMALRAVLERDCLSQGQPLGQGRKRRL